MYPQRSVMTCGLATALEPPHFNHAPVRGAIGASFSRRSRAGSFNPRTRVGCDPEGSLEAIKGFFVSIHAPAWGATALLGEMGEVVDVSIHAPAWGATQTGRLPAHAQGVSIHAPAWGATSRGVGMPDTDGFQSTHPRGVRHVTTTHQLADGLVSIHAPAWGATCSL